MIRVDANVEPILVNPRSGKANSRPRLYFCGPDNSRKRQDWLAEAAGFERILKGTALEMGEKDRLGAVHSQSGQDCRALLSDYATAGFTAAIVQIAACHPFVDAIATPVLIIEVRITQCCMGKFILRAGP
jgi:hypothetical protein